MSSLTSDISALVVIVVVVSVSTFVCSLLGKLFWDKFLWPRQLPTPPLNPHLAEARFVPAGTRAARVGMRQQPNVECDCSHRQQHADLPEHRLDHLYDVVERSRYATHSLAPRLPNRNRDGCVSTGARSALPMKRLDNNQEAFGILGINDHDKGSNDSRIRSYILQLEDQNLSPIVMTPPPGAGRKASGAHPASSAPARRQLNFNDVSNEDGSDSVFMSDRHQQSNAAAAGTGKSSYTDRPALVPVRPTPKANVMMESRTASTSDGSMMGSQPVVPTRPASPGARRPHTQPHVAAVASTNDADDVLVPIADDKKQQWDGRPRPPGHTGPTPRAKKLSLAASHCSGQHVCRQCGQVLPCDLSASHLDLAIHHNLKHLDQHLSRVPDDMFQVLDKAPDRKKGRPNRKKVLVEGVCSLSGEAVDYTRPDHSLCK